MQSQRLEVSGSQCLRWNHLGHTPCTVFCSLADHLLAGLESLTSDSLATLLPACSPMLHQQELAWISRKAGPVQELDWTAVSVILDNTHTVASLGVPASVADALRIADGMHLSIRCAHLGLGALPANMPLLAFNLK